MLIYNARILYGEDFELVRGYVKIKNGEIQEIGSGGKKGDINAKGGIVLPGFINTHVHILDALGKESCIGKKLDEVVRPPAGYKHRILRNTPERTLISSARNAIYEMVSNGITTFCEFSNDPLLSRRAVEGIKVRPILLYEPVVVQSENEIAKDVFDPYIVDLVAKNAKNCDGVGISGVCEFSDTTLKEIADSTEYRYLALHAAEHSVSQKRSLKLTGKTEIERAVKLKPNFLVHVTNPTRKDLKIIARRKIPVVCCPRCNALLGVGAPPILEFLKKKIPIALGTDNIMLNSPDMFREMEFLSKLLRYIYKDPGIISTREILKMATVNAAKIFGLNSGVILEGRVADIIVLRPLRNMHPLNDVVSSVVHRADARNVWMVIVGGKIVRV